MPGTPPAATAIPEEEIMRYIIDRAEGEFWVLEGPERRMRSVPKDLLPSHCREGDVLEENGGIYRIDSHATARRKAMLQEKLEKLRKNAQKD